MPTVFVRGACRISGNFAIFFCKIFAQNLRDLDALLALYSWYQIKRRGELSVGEGLVEAKCYKRRGQIKRRGGSWQGEML